MFKRTIFSVANRKDLARFDDPVVLGIIAARARVPGVVIEIDDERDDVSLLFNSGWNVVVVTGFDAALVKQAALAVIGDRSKLIDCHHAGQYVPPQEGSPYRINWTYEESQTGYKVFLKMLTDTTAVG